MRNLLPWQWVSEDSTQSKKTLGQETYKDDSDVAVCIARTYYVSVLHYLSVDITC